MLVDLTYIALVFCMTVLGLLLGIAGHFMRAHMTRWPEKLTDSDLYNAALMDNYLFEKHAVEAEWDDAGYWDPDSLRNLVYYAISGVLVPLIAGLYFWDQRVEIVRASCKLMLGAGLNPPMCF